MKKAFTLSHLGIPRIPSSLTSLPQYEKERRGFTLVELIVVITILAILGMIAFISLQNYSKEARDSKRLQDVRNLLTKLNIENVKGIPYGDMLKNSAIHQVRIGGDIKDVEQGIINFEYLRENRDNFIDPDTGNDYDFATAIGTAKYLGVETSYNFIQGRYWSERNMHEVIMGNYYKFDASDSDDLFTGSINTKPGEFSCNDLTKPTDNGHITYIDGTPGASNVSWQGSNKNSACYYKCLDGYWGNGCANLPITVADCTEAGEVLQTYTYFTDAKYNIECDTGDIILCSGVGSGYQLAACNVGASIAGDHHNCVYSGGGDIITTFEGSDCETSKLGMHFQWGMSKGYEINKSVAEQGGWNTNAYGNLSSDWPNAGKDLCGTDYHISTREEWHDITELGNAVTPKLWTITQIGLHGGYPFRSRDSVPADRNNFMSILKLPMAGARLEADGVLDDIGNYGDYWTQNPYSVSPKAHYLAFHDTRILSSSFYNASYGFSVRCFRD